MDPTPVYKKEHTTYVFVDLHDLTLYNTCPFLALPENFRISSLFTVESDNTVHMFHILFIII